ncbi:MAG: hypothetical protein OEM38_07920, partial [Gammaproteobacteria bacterium]|nr:hypothetical protein [Gammaproteobacteria bacterium]
LTASSGTITMQAGSSTVTSRDNKTLYQANTNLQVTEISGGSVTLDSKTGSISGSFINGTHVDGREVSLLSSSGISAVNESGGVDEFKVVASTLNVTNASNDVLLATQSDTFDANSPESNPLKMGNISVSSGNIAINNVGAIQFVEQVDVEGGVNVASSSQVTIDKKFSAKNDIDIIVAPGDFQFGADGLTLSSSGSIESSQGNINLEINDLVQLLGEVEALGGDITVKSERNAIAVTHINAGSHKATVKAGLSIQALDSNKVHIIADAVELVTGTDGAIGTFAKPVELSTNQTTFNANNYSYMTGNLGIIINSGFGRFLDPGVAISSANKGQSTSAQEFSFVDATVFSPELNLFDRVNEGIRLPEDQLED